MGGRQRGRHGGSAAKCDAAHNSCSITQDLSVALVEYSSGPGEIQSISGKASDTINGKERHLINGDETEVSGCKR